MKTVFIALLIAAILVAVDIVMYLLLSVEDRHWEKRFENEEDENDDNERGV